jgi:hypothetical protein
MFTLSLLYVCFNLFAILVTTRHSYSYRYNLSYLILLHLQSCDSYNLHDLYAIFYTDIWLILSVKRTPYECAMKNYSIQDMLYTPGPGCSNDNLWLKFNQSTQCVVQFMAKFNYWLKHG